MRGSLRTGGQLRTDPAHVRFGPLKRGTCRYALPVSLLSSSAAEVRVGEMRGCARLHLELVEGGTFKVVLEATRAAIVEATLLFTSSSGGSLAIPVSARILEPTLFHARANSLHVEREPPPSGPIEMMPLVASSRAVQILRLPGRRAGGPRLGWVETTIEPPAAELRRRRRRGGGGGGGGPRHRRDAARARPRRGPRAPTSTDRGVRTRAPRVGAGGEGGAADADGGGDRQVWEAAGRRREGGRVAAGRASPVDADDRGGGRRSEALSRRRPPPPRRDPAGGARARARRGRRLARAPRPRRPRRGASRAAERRGGGGGGGRRRGGRRRRRRRRAARRRRRARELRTQCAGWRWRRRRRGRRCSRRRRR